MTTTQPDSEGLPKELKDAIDGVCNLISIADSFPQQRGSNMLLAFDDAFGYYIYIFLYLDFFCHGAFCPGDTT